MPPRQRPERPQPDNSTATGLGASTPGTPATPRTLADTGANPPGPPEGTDHGHAGDGPEPTPAATEVDPTPTDTAQVLEPERESEGGSPGARLVTYLRAHHPEELGRVTPQGPEHPADTAVRLLTRLGARGTAQARCTEAYCNLPEGHLEEHGWIHA